MASLDDTDVSVLLMLAEEAQGTGRRLHASTVASKFKPTITERMADLSLRHLHECQLADATFDNPRNSGYSITRLGLRVVELHFEREEHGSNTSWIRKTDAPQTVDLMAHSKTRKLQSHNSLGEQNDDRPFAIHIHNNVSPVITQSVDAGKEPDKHGKSAARASWTSAVIALVLGTATIFVTLWIAGKI